MADNNNCPKCKKSIGAKEAAATSIGCSGEDCRRRFHRTCVNIDDAVYEAIQKNPMISFHCEECKKEAPRGFAAKLQTIEEKVNKVCNGVNQIQGRMYQQYFQFGNQPLQALGASAAGVGGGVGGMAGGLDGKKHPQQNNLIVVGNNCNSDRLQVVCDYGRWVQVGKFATNTSEEDVIDHLAEELKINKNLVKCTKLVKNDANLSQLSYCKFKISIPDYRFNELFNEAIWPSGVMVSPFTPRSQLNQNRL
ncbi:hypothetical protein KR084_003938 [Drosophila pseudotakahashii]|nr:hypothetical protein KR084_003938 [Drosophila pseudotakahashii]